MLPVFNLGRFASSDIVNYAEKELLGHKEGSDKNRVCFCAIHASPNIMEYNPTLLVVAPCAVEEVQARNMVRDHSSDR